MDKKTIQKKICAILMERFELDEKDVKCHRTEMSILGLDEFDLIDLALMLEEAFNLRIDQVTPDATICDLTDIIESGLKQIL